MRTFAPDFLRQTGVRLFEACGAPPGEAAIVADDLVTTSLMGLESHGVTRFVHYVDDARAGKLKPGAPLRVLQQTTTSVTLDCGLNYGQVGAARLVDLVSARASEVGVACGVTRRSHHIGRLGAVVQRVAELGAFGLAAVNSFKGGHFVVPWGGREGRLATNPLAYGVPTGGRPVVMDMSTSMIAEGKIRALMNAGQPIPPGCVLDADGNPCTDAAAWYGPPRGTILPFGRDMGYKGFGLGLLVEILGGALAGQALSDGYEYVNGLFLLVIHPDAFCGRQRFVKLMEELCVYIRGTPPAAGSHAVMMPGDLDWRMHDRRVREGIPLPDATWQQIVAAGQRVGVAIDTVAKS